MHCQKAKKHWIQRPRGVMGVVCIRLKHGAECYRVADCLSGIFHNAFRMVRPYAVALLSAFPGG